MEKAMNFWKVPGNRIKGIAASIEMYKRSGRMFAFLRFDPELEKLIVQELGYKCTTYKRDGKFYTVVDFV